MTEYPVQVECQHQDRYSRLLPFVKWLLIIPHLIVLSFVAIGAAFGAIAAFFVVLVTGRYPRGIFDFVVGTLRWWWNLSAYSYFLTDAYPPFALSAQPDHPVTFEVPYPEDGIARWRPLVHWLLIIPYGIAVYVLMIVAALLQFISFFVILITGKLPEGIFDIMQIAFRWQLRAAAYSLWLTDRYPPFEGGEGASSGSGGAPDRDSTWSTGGEIP